MQSLRIEMKYSFAILFFLMCAIFCSPLRASAAQKKQFVVVIDAGHGGNDSGAIENGVKEKDVNLAVALKLGNLIKKKLKDTEVVFTRNSDNFVSLQGRADIANKAKGDLFISIHCNSVDRNNKNRSNVAGATTYVLGRHKDGDNLAVARRENSVVELDANDKAHFSQYNPSEDESHIIFEMTQKKNLQNSVRFASDVQKQMEAGGRISRGVQQAGFWVLWSTAMPAALIELDFICNPQQAQFLNSNDGQEKLANAIFNAVKNYESYFRKSTGTQAQNVDSPKEADKEMAQNTSSGKNSDLTPDGRRRGDRKVVSERKKRNQKEKANKKESSENSKIQRKTVVAEVPAVEVETPVQMEVADINNESLSGNVAELPPAESATAPRRHRAATSSSTKKSSSSSSHRRRSSRSAAQNSQVEQAVIAMNNEPGADISVSSESSVTNTAKPSNKNKEKTEKAAKNNSKSKKKDETSKPARRSKDSNTKRKAVKQNVNSVFMVLLFSSDKELKAGDEAFQGLSPVASFRENNKFNYTYGESPDRLEMEKLLIEVSEFFPDARVIKRYL